MSFLILAFRKLSLKRKINSGNFRLMQLQMTKDRIASQLAATQQLNATIQDNWNTFTSSIGNMTSSVFSAQLNASSNNATEALKKYQEARESGDEKAIKDAETNMYMANTIAANEQKQLMLAQNTEAIALAALKRSANSIFETQEKAELETLQRKDQSIELEMTSLQTQLSSWEAEYNNLDKAVSEAAKNSAPKYC